MDNDSEQQSPDNTKPPGFGARHCQAIMTFLCLVLAYAMRVNLSVGIVAMTDSTGTNSDLKVLPWDSSIKGIILSSFFWGYLILQVPAGEMARRLGSKYPLFIAMLICSLFTLFSPYIAQNYSWQVFCATRVIQGLLQGFFTPSINAHMSKWAPPLERCRLFAFVFIGSQFGTLVTLFVAGYLAASPWGWPSIFYATGLCSLLWAVVWMFIGADCPDTHTSISVEERHYINSSLINTSAESKTLPTPWWDVATSVPLWSLLIAHLGQNWGYWMLLTELPSYFSHVLGFNIKNNGLISALPYLIMCSLTVVFSWIADFINKRGILPISVSRKMWNSIAHWGAAAALMCLSFTSTVTGAVVLLTTSISLNAGIYTGFLQNHLDLAPNFAGLLMGITNGFANITAIIGPMITGFIVSDESNKDQWMIAFYLAAAAFFVGNLIFMIFGSTEVQPWNDPLKKDYLDKKQIV
ncbi:putative inorganic phosphate cotransporter [Homalodisca vitripennis]|uniref:putative inorganic phosphate cotransporter n=1 Tax=Homalodisca vitripennis TaxID=197043 RepID=UPI001EEC2929|nr:putative inorganic phosphate cotransporter [Homalodisca vitripennis]